MECRVRLLPEAVQVFLGEGNAPEDVIPVLLDAALLARENRLHDLIVISGVGDPVSAEAVSQALEQMHATGQSSPFRIAFVADRLPQYAAYHFAERYAQRFGIVVKVFVSMADAKEWLALAVTHKSATGRSAVRL